MRRRSVGQPTGIFGPYPHRSRWRLVLREGGKQTVSSYATKDEAEKVKRTIERKLAEQPPITLDSAMAEYEAYLRDDKGNKPASYTATIWRLRRFFPLHELPIAEVSHERCTIYYKVLREAVSPQTGKPLAVDSHRNILAEARTFMTWCIKKKWLAKNPLDGVEGQGRRRHGKPQLRIDEAKRWRQEAVKLAEQGEAGAVAAMMTLYMALRCGEVVSRLVRDLDHSGQILWVEETDRGFSPKTQASRRPVEVPDVLRPYLIELARGRSPDQLLFGQHWRDWPRHWVKRICGKAGVPAVSAHAMRGLHATLSVRTGLSPHAVAASLGHESPSTTLQSYVAPGTHERASRERALRILEDEPRG